LAILAAMRRAEGLVSKRADAPYTSGRTSDWIKTTRRHRDTFAVAGWAERMEHFDGVYLERREDGQIICAGKLEKDFLTKTSAQC
jgi:bifunctional non-homologous end joining protein LigD